MIRSISDAFLKFHKGTWQHHSYPFKIGVFAYKKAALSHKNQTNKKNYLSLPNLSAYPIFEDAASSQPIDFI